MNECGYVGIVRRRGEIIKTHSGCIKSTHGNTCQSTQRGLI